MDESTKSKKHWGELEKKVLQGTGIDIGCGPDPVMPDVKRFDMDDGDANIITEYVKEQFDYVYSAHCLEHMFYPEKTILEWWKLVKPGGYLFFMVPDEDLYEQGIFPSIFNPDHKATFTISKRSSWSPRSYNILDLVNSIPDGKVLKLELQDEGYDRTLMSHYSMYSNPKWIHALENMVEGLRLSKKLIQKIIPEWFLSKYRIKDQTYTNALAQIACIVQKNSN
tara:strand:+ start:16337 stop:17008 length:672 start_codon:yes stop_codon:yes gene_type:complete